MTRPAVLASLAERIAALSPPARVAIDGPDAAGKTTLADELAELLALWGQPVMRISADDYLRPPAERYRRGRDSPEGYYADSFDHAPLRAAVVAATGLVLVDGVFLFRAELDDLWSFRVFVAVDEEEAVRRGVERDASLRPSVEETERLYRVRYLAGHRLYVAAARPHARADVMVENDDPARPRLVVGGGERRHGS